MAGLTPEELKKFNALNSSNLTEEQKNRIAAGQGQLTPPSANDPYAAARAARWEGQGSAPPQKSSAPPIPQSESGAATGAQNSLDKMAEVRNSNNIGDLARLARGASAVANSGPTYAKLSSESLRFAPTIKSDITEDQLRKLEAVSARQPMSHTGQVPTVTKFPTEKSSLNPSIDRLGPPQSNPTVADRATVASFLQKSPNSQSVSSDASGTTPSGTSVKKTGTVDPLTPYEHDMRALDIIRGDRDKRIAQRALVPHATPVDIDKLEKTADLARFKAQSAFDNTTGNSRKKGMAAQIVLDSYKPVLDALAGGGKEENALEKQRLASQADLQSKGNASDARIAAQESRNQMLEKLSKDRLDTQLALANRPRYTPAREEYTDDLGDKVTNIVPFDQSTGTVDRSATGGLSGKQYEAVKEAQRISAKLQDKKPLSKSEQAHWDKWGSTEEIWGKVR